MHYNRKVQGGRFGQTPAWLQGVLNTDIGVLPLHLGPAWL